MLVAKLKDLIENKKLELVELVNKHGFSHTKVLYLSQEIDNLINKYMIIKKRNPIIVGFKGNRYIK